MAVSQWSLNATFADSPEIFDQSTYDPRNTTTTTFSSIFNNNTLSTTQRPDFCQLPRKLTNDVAFGCLLFFIPITVIGNLLVVAVIFSSASLRKQTAYLFLASLAVADTLVGVVSMPFNARVQWRGGFLCLGADACWIYLLGEIFLSITSVTHLFVIGVDRYLSLRYVYQYNSLATRRRVGVVIAGIWVFSAFVASLVTFKWDEPSKIAIRTKLNHECAPINVTYFTTIYVTFFIIPLFAMMYMYRYVYKTASRHIIQIVQMEIMDPTLDKKSRDKKRKKRQYRTLRSIVVVFLVYCVCWYPTIFFILSLFHAKEFWRQYSRQNWWKALHFLLINFLPPLNSTTNPFIYVISNKQFRKVCTQLYFKIVTSRKEQRKEQRSLRYATTIVSETVELHPMSSKNKRKLLSPENRITVILANSNSSNLNETSALI